MAPASSLQGDSDMEVSDGEDELLIKQTKQARHQHVGRVYPIQQLLRLSASPLVSSRALGIKPLKEWYGEFEPPTHNQRPEQHSPPNRSRPIDGAYPNNRTSRTARGAPRGDADSTPFGQGAMGDFKLPQTGIRNAARNRPPLNETSSDTLSRDRERDFTSTEGERRRFGQSLGTFEGREGHNNFRSRDGRPERNERRPESFTADSDSAKPVSTFGRRDGRAEEAGWTSSSAQARDRRQASSARFERNDRERTPYGNNSYNKERDKREYTPAWMEEEEPNTASSSETPLWASSDPTKDSDSGFLEHTSKSKARGSERVTDLGPHIDEIQAFKAQMRAQEQRAKEKEMGTLVETAGDVSKDRLAQPEALEKTPQPQSRSALPASIQEDAVIKSEVKSSANNALDLFNVPSTSTADFTQKTSQPSSNQSTAAQSSAGPRASRFAKYFKAETQPSGATNTQSPANANVSTSIPTSTTAPAPASQRETQGLTALFGLSPPPESSSSNPSQANKQAAVPAGDMLRVMEMLRLSSQPSPAPQTSASPSQGGRDPIQEGRALFKERVNQPARSPGGFESGDKHNRSSSSQFYDTLSTQQGFPLKPQYQQDRFTSNGSTDGRSPQDLSSQRGPTDRTAGPNEIAAHSLPGMLSPHSFRNHNPSSQSGSPASQHPQFSLMSAAGVSLPHSGLPPNFNSPHSLPPHLDQRNGARPLQSFSGNGQRPPPGLGQPNQMQQPMFGNDQQQHSGFGGRSLPPHNMPLPPQFSGMQQLGMGMPAPPGSNPRNAPPGMPMQQQHHRAPPFYAGPPPVHPPHQTAHDLMALLNGGAAFGR